MDIVVVGAGIIGCAIGYALTSRGARVRLVDMRRPGAGATQASAGVLCPHLEGHVTAATPLTIASVATYDAFVAQVRRDSGAAIEYRRNGTLELAFDDAEATQLEGFARSHVAAGIAHELFTGAEACALEPTLNPRVCAALLVPSHGYVAAHALTLALARAATQLGAVVQTEKEVQTIQPARGCVRVRTSTESWQPDAIVLAAGAWAGQIATGSNMPSHVRPIRGQLLQVRGAAVPHRMIWSTRCYLVPWEDGSILVGATVEDVGFDETATVEGVSTLWRGACDVLPGLSSARIDDVRVGLRPGTDDGLPIIGRSSRVPGLVYATGHGRNGVMLAPLTAAIVADLLLDHRESSHLKATSPARFGL
ncbi:MAG: glycine oxidase ThiO [Gemmatimonadaceae bacterium]